MPHVDVDRFAGITEVTLKRRAHGAEHPCAIRTESMTDGTRVNVRRDMSVTNWERRAEWPLAGVAVAFLIAYAWPILDPTLNRAAAATCHAVVIAAWIVFAV